MPSFSHAGTVGDAKREMEIIGMRLDVMREQEKTIVDKSIEAERAIVRAEEARNRCNDLLEQENALKASVEERRMEIEELESRICKLTRDEQIRRQNVEDEEMRMLALKDEYGKIEKGLIEDINTLEEEIVALLAQKTSVIASTNYAKEALASIPAQEQQKRLELEKLDKMIVDATARVLSLQQQEAELSKYKINFLCHSEQK